MKLSSVLLVIFTVGLGVIASAEEKTASQKEEIKALIREDAKAAAAKSAPAKTPAAVPATAPATPATATTDTSKETKKPADPKVTETAAATPATTLPTVEVNRRKISELDRELYEQEKQIAREKKNTKVSEVDSALNSTTFNPTILGGASGKVRAAVAQERVEMMEFEKDLTEAIARAKTKEEKAALKKQLDDIRTMRRLLDAPPEKGR